MPSSVRSNDRDQTMADDAPLNDTEMQEQNPDELEEEIHVAEFEKQRITVLPGASETAASFQFEGEDHTLGNALRYIIMKNPDVEFCGYTMPHPSETKMNLRIQTYASTNVFEVLDKGLSDLIDLCDVVTETFTTARDDFETNKMQ
ncbi:DNA-directed RNA polymerases I and III 16 kDa polypeptide, putative [Coccidioides posadasii C735 delta SOWgp]|uniref:DNA-directed RNA polymerases I and III subunit RPAC2 n=1 Tax=Coccidioides posadasii (strain C735) TaxID=222929 RepID=C5P253_COCP7|nr:DNA-directed RNA polymerases I and III 16 kDa polypeptide, putative [Coccidioides posadasii C735 delta SOWgp]EER28956.1 DNA-directed RNA polymerases I and III 16 kDa polypeptide, putative [Coccidioides posadasii C735 delta SOWgp]|eukprot:XP_003071101.1 DNA-directed RNA polymerases I and III 16 kDa polypeptide, putative [Coccidioides posadasii C735 delta SOWgp]